MSNKKDRSISAEGREFRYLEFPNLKAFHDFTEQESQQLSPSNFGVWKGIHKRTGEMLASGSDWFGTPPPESLEALSNHERFSHMDLLETIRPEIQQHLSAYLHRLDTEYMPRPTLSYNHQGLGLFSFERAAMGLHRNIAPLDLTNAQLRIELGHQQQALDQRLTTSVKTVYAFFENSSSANPSLRLYLMAGGNAQIQGDQLLYVGLACAELVNFLELRGIGVAVHIILGSYFHYKHCMAVIRIKDFETPADLNQILLMASDPSYFRYRGFKALVCLANHFGLSIPEGLGRMEKGMGKDFVRALKIKEAHYVFEQSYSLEQAANEVRQGVETFLDHTKSKLA